MFWGAVYEARQSGAPFWMWTCAVCGATHDRDVNAAINIRHQGILQLKAAGLSVSAHGGSIIPSPIGMVTA